MAITLKLDHYKRQQAKSKSYENLIKYLLEVVD